MYYEICLRRSTARYHHNPHCCTKCSDRLDSDNEDFYNTLHKFFADYEKNFKSDTVDKIVPLDEPLSKSVKEATNTETSLNISSSSSKNSRKKNFSSRECTNYRQQSIHKTKIPQKSCKKSCTKKDTKVTILRKKQATVLTTPVKTQSRVLSAQVKQATVSIAQRKKQASELTPPLKKQTSKSTPKSNGDKIPGKGTLKRKRWFIEQLQRKNENYEDDLFENKKFNHFESLLEDESDNSDDYTGIKTPEFPYCHSPRENTPSPQQTDCYSIEQLNHSRKQCQKYQYQVRKRRKLVLPETKKEPETHVETERQVATELQRESFVEKLLQIEKHFKDYVKGDESDSDSESESDHYFSGVLKE